MKINRPINKKFQDDLGLTDSKARHLISLCRQSFSIQVRWHNGPRDSKPASEKQAQASVQKVENFAEQNGLITRWPGLWPNFAKKTTPEIWVELPE